MVQGQSATRATQDPKQNYDGWSVYKCPHCSGFIGVHARIPHYDIGIEVATFHWEAIPEFLSPEEYGEVRQIREGVEGCPVG